MSSLRLRHKLAFGLGQVAEGIKNSSFEMFLFFYYNQVLGLSGSLSGLAVMLALVVDAVTDPLVGSWSDAHRGRLGRRHPFMYAAAVPLLVTFYLLFAPPAGLGEWGLFAWLTVFAVLVRSFMTLHIVPLFALGAELATDYHERTSVVAYRLFFGVFAGLTTASAGLFYFFRATPKYPTGQQNPAGYPLFAATFAVVMLLSVLVSAAGTQRPAAALAATSSDTPKFTLWRLWGEVKAAFGGRSFRMVFFGLILFYVMRGAQQTLSLHLNTFFWELPTKQVGAVTSLLFVGMVVGVPLWAFAARFMEKRPTYIAGTIIYCVFIILPPTVKLLGFWPDALTVPLLGGASFLAALGGAGALVVASSMMADLVDEHELHHGRRQEGVYFGATNFSAKCSSGLGHWVAGVGVDLVGFPTNAEPGTVPQPVVDRLGILYGPCAALFAVASVYLLAQYRLDRDRVAEIQGALAARHAAGPNGRGE